MPCRGGGGDDAMHKAASKITTAIAGAGKRTAGRLVHRRPRSLQRRRRRPAIALFLASKFRLARIAVDTWLLRPLRASRNATLGQPSLQGGRAKYALTQWSVVVGSYLRHLRACYAGDALKVRGSEEKPQNLGFVASTNFRPQKSMPPMPPMPPPPGIAGASFFGCSVIVASVVTIRPAIDAAS